LKGLAQLARDNNIAVLVIHHLRKKGLFDGEEISLDRVRGSSAITQIARVVWAIDRPDPDNRERGRLSVIKHNLSAYPDPIGFTIGSQGIAFGDAPSTPHIRSQTERAADFLGSFLADGRRPSKQVYAEGARLGLSQSTLKRAKKRLGIKAEKAGNTWYWVFPGKAKGEDI
jgi:hypothetical protein